MCSPGHQDGRAREGQRAHAARAARANARAQGDGKEQQAATGSASGDASAALLAFLQKKDEVCRRDTALPAPRDVARAASQAPAAAHVDICASLTTASLEGLPSDLLPRRRPARRGDAWALFRVRRPRRSSDLVDELASEVAKLRKRGIEKGFVCVKLSKWLPQHLAGALRDADEDEAKLSEDLKNLAQALGIFVVRAGVALVFSREAMGAKATPKRVLPTLSQWHLAWSRYAVGAHATGQLTYAAAAAHRDVCMAVGLGAARNKRRVQLAVYYDEQARKDWAERSRSGDSSFVARTRFFGARAPAMRWPLRLRAGGSRGKAPGLGYPGPRRGGLRCR